MISIHNPCPESWDKMTPQGQGRHCDVCCKVVVDFTACSKEELLDYFSLNRDRKTCGRFRKEQLVQQRPKRRLSRFAAALAVVFGAALFTSCKDEPEHVVGDVCVDSATLARRGEIADSMLKAESLKNVKAESGYKLSKEDSTRVADSVARNQNGVRDFK